ncbi:MAG: hypothetical protein E6Q66_05975 [Pedobacter sp.]|nr:MAG: hypothetical protein E6Q66_05975 [Pedobacter sp.]
MELQEINQKRRRGDIITVAEILEISESNTRTALTRIGSKHHSEVVALLTRVIRIREMLKKEQEVKKINRSFLN